MRNKVCIKPLNFSLPLPVKWAQYYLFSTSELGRVNNEAEGLSSCEFFGIRELTFIIMVLFRKEVLLQRYKHLRLLSKQLKTTNKAELRPRQVFKWPCRVMVRGIHFSNGTLPYKATALKSNSSSTEACKTKLLP